MKTKTPKEIEASGNNPSQKKSYQTFEEELKEEIKRLKKFPQDKSYKNMCVFDEVRKLKAELKGFQKSQEMMREDELEWLEEFKTRLDVWEISGYIKESIDDRIKILSKIGGKE